MQQKFIRKFTGFVQNRNIRKNEARSLETNADFPPTIRLAYSATLRTREERREHAGKVLGDDASRLVAALYQIAKQLLAQILTLLRINAA